MPVLFTVKWPRLAQIEAALLFPVAVATAGEIAAGVFGFDAGFTGLVTSDGASSDLVGPGLSLLVLVTVAAVPFLALLIAVDRLLIIPKGFAILSGLATILWAGAAALLSDGLAAMLPSDFAPGFGFVSFRGGVAMIAGAAALAAHAKILWIGLHDEGFAAMRLGVERRLDDRSSALALRYLNIDGAPQDDDDHDLRRRRRRWLLNESDIQRWRTPVETALVLIFVSGWIYAGYRWIYSEHHPEPTAGVAVAVTEAMDGAEANAIPDAPAIDGAASTGRDRRGRFVFATTVNGVSIPMVYNDDVSHVTLRAEDALRLGISFARLDFSDKIQTDDAVIEVAGITIYTMTVGSITYRLVPGFVARPGALTESILGHSFLGRLATNRMQNNRITVTGTR
jgi:aspartyl protease family protein